MESDKGQVESQTRPIVWWGHGDEERLTHETLDEFLADHVDAMDREPIEGDTVKACGYARMVPCASMVDPLEHCLERFEEEYGDPDGSGDWEADERMGVEALARLKAAEAAFVAAVIAEYVPWMCEVVTTQTVDLYAWWQERRFGRAPFESECDTDPHGQAQTDTDGAECGEACVCDLVSVEPDPNQTEAIPDEPEPIDMDAEIAAEQAFAERRATERLRTSAPDMATAAGTVYTPRLGDSIRHREKHHLVFHVTGAGPDGVSVISATGTNLASTLEPSELADWWLVPGGVKSAEVAK